MYEIVHAYLWLTIGCALGVTIMALIQSNGPDDL
jgi:hypothetical protein